MLDQVARGVADCAVADTVRLLGRLLDDPHTVSRRFGISMLTSFTLFSRAPTGRFSIP